jgi:ketosteroid isomerase-like protein
MVNSTTRGQFSTDTTPSLTAGQSRATLRPAGDHGGDSREERGFAMDRSTKVKEPWLRFYECANTGNIGILEQIISHQPGVLCVGTDPNEWWVGHEAIVRIYGQQLKELNGAMKVEAGDVTALAEGTVGWIADNGKCRMPDGSAVPVRMTAVFHQQGGEWKIVQMHASVGVSNADALGKDLTTT